MTERIVRFLVLTFMLSVPALAQDYNHTLETLNNFNRIKPLQNPEYEHADDLLERRVLDRKNKVVGEVRDILLNTNGSISSIAVEFNRLRLNTEVYLNTRTMDVSPVSNGYALSIEDDQIRDIYPELLAGIETASGQSDVFSVKNITGAKIRAADGRYLGLVDQVLFGGHGERAEALYVKMKYGTLRGKSIAIPFGSAQFSTHGSQTKITVNDTMADAMISFAKNN